MRIVIDMQGAQTASRFRGIGRYSTALAQAILRNAGTHEVWLVLNSHFPEATEDVQTAFKGLLPEERIVVFEVPPLITWDAPSNAWRRRAAELIRESFLAALQPDVVFVTSLFEGADFYDTALSVGTFETDIPTVVTLYDLIPLLNQKTYLGTDRLNLWYQDKIENLKRADLLLSISYYSRQEAIDALGIEGNRIVNISSAHTGNFHPCEVDDDRRENWRSCYGITKPFVMYNGALDSRKNLDRLLQAFALLPSSLRQSYQLVFVGNVLDFDRIRLQRLAVSLGIDGQFVLTGYISDNELAALFSGCTLFVFPSLHEGFGLPALEAMACGAATIGSNTTSIPEVIGRSDALFDPSNPDDIAAKIARALSDEVFLSSLREHALTQASKFSWDLCAKQAIAAFEKFGIRNTLPQQHSLVERSVNEKTRYQKLIEAISLIPNQPAAPSVTDLCYVASCIESNFLISERFGKPPGGEALHL